MKKIFKHKAIVLLTVICLSAINTVFGQLPKPYVRPNTKPIVITEMSLYLSRRYASELDSLSYHDYSIDELTSFYRCMSDTLFVGYVLVPTGNDTVYYTDLINNHGNPFSGITGKQLHLFDLGRFKTDVTMMDVQQAENALAVCVNNIVDFKSIRKRYRSYRRQYVFFYDENGEMCVLINCCCDEDRNFSHRFRAVRDGGDCFWKMIINLKTQEPLSVSVNGEA